MARWGAVIDLDTCTACGACVIACKEENNVAYVSPDEAEDGRAMAWMTMVSEVSGEYPNVEMRYLPHLCMHCDNPPCTKVCPVRATYLSDEGIVAQIYPRCIGCRYCMAACPYTVKVFNWYDPEWMEGMERVHNPDVSLRQKGVVEKCTFCHHRLQKAREKARMEERDTIDGEYNIACAEICPTSAITFGNLDDSNSKVSYLARSTRAFRLLEELGTEPKVYYLKEGEKIV